MGKPGGFFKRLKAKQSRQAARRRRGTKGASKDERRRKQAERVEYYAARREAEQLAAISSSSASEAGGSDDDDNKDSDDDVDVGMLPHVRGGDTAQAAEQARRRRAATTTSSSRVRDSERKLQRLRALLHVAPTKSTTATARAGKRTRDAALLSDASSDSNDDDSDSDSASSTAAAVDDAAAAHAARANDTDEDDDDTHSGNDADDDNDDDDSDDALLVDEDDEAAYVDNPLFDADDNDAKDAEDDDDDDDAADLFAQVDDNDDDNDDDDADEEREDAYVDNDDDGDDVDGDDNASEQAAAAAARHDASTQQHRLAERATLLRRHDATAATTTMGKKQRTTTTTATLQPYTPHTSSEAYVQAMTGIDASDPWLQKYHLDTHGKHDDEATKTTDNNNNDDDDDEDAALTPVPVSDAALAALRDCNADYAARAAAREAAQQQQQQAHEDVETRHDAHATATTTTRDVFDVSADEYAQLRPDNVAIAASARARQHLLHAPFDLATTTADETKNDDGGKSSAAAASTTTRPPYMHEALWRKWLTYCAGNDNDDNDDDDDAVTFARGRPPLTVEERGLLDVLQAYPDVLDCTRCWQVSQSRREVLLLHMLNHWFKARAVVLAHDERLRQQQRQRRRRRGSRRETETATSSSNDSKNKNKKKSKKKRSKDDNIDDNNDNNNDDDEDDEVELRDRGFGKTRLLLVLPMRNTAYRYVHTLVRLLGASPSQCPKLSVFSQDFREVAEAVDPRFHRRPIDYQRQFDGNIDDAFCVGLRLEPHRVHVYAHPLNSDVLLCSPLGLRRRLEKAADVAVSLAAVEVCVVDEAHVLLQQNWQHMTALLALLNRRPTDTTHGLADVRRVYAWALRGAAVRHRQTVLCSDWTHATLLATLRTSVNDSGKVLLTRRDEAGSLAHVTLPVRQHFLRFAAASLADVDEARFAYFVEHVLRTRLLPLLERDVRVVLYVPSYFDYVRLRQYLHREHRETYAALCEYTPPKQQRRALGQFSDLERPLLLLTERFYFFRRYYVKLAEVVVFYSPPQFASFYTALVNRLVAASPNACAMTLYCRYDTHELHRLVGTTRLRQMLQHASGIVSFVTH